MKPKGSHICIAIFLMALFPLNSAVDCFNDINEADFLCVGKKIENIDPEDFVGEKSCPPGVMILANILFEEFGIILAFLPNFSLPLPIPSAVLGTLRC